MACESRTIQLAVSFIALIRSVSVVWLSQVLFAWSLSSNLAILTTHVSIWLPYSYVNVLTVDDTGAINDAVIWSSIEPSMGVVSACLPTLRPLILYLFPQLDPRATRNVARPETRSSPCRARVYAYVGSPWPGFLKRGPAQGENTATISALHSNRNADHVDVMPDKVKVQKEVRLTSEIV